MCPLAATKQKYLELCNSENVSIFAQPWWLDLACGANWDVILIAKSEEVVAALPIYFRQKAGFTTVVQPPQSPANGLYIKYPAGQKYTTRLGYEKDILTEIAERIDKLRLSAFYQQFPYTLTNWLPFYWKGFSQSTRYTYVLEDLSDINKVYEEVRSNIKTDIKKAEKNVSLVELSPTEFYALYQKTFKRQGLEGQFSTDYFQKLDNELHDRGSRRILGAKDKDGNLHAGVYLIWDKTSVYYFLSGSDPQLRNSGAVSYLLWEAVKFASEQGKRFDFEGSMIEPIERHFRAFGGIQKPYFVISKEYSPILRLLKRLFSR